MSGITNRPPDDVSGTSYKRKRTGVLATSYYNAIGLPGVQAVDDATGAPDAAYPGNVSRIQFTGDGTELYFPPDAVYRDPDTNELFMLVRNPDAYSSYPNQVPPKVYRKIGTIAESRANNGPFTIKAGDTSPFAFRVFHDVPPAITRNSTAEQDGYFYSYYAHPATSVYTADATLYLGQKGSYKLTWANAYNVVAGKGWKVGSGTRAISYWADFQPKGNAYLSIYGWTKSPLIEYYVVESWASTFKPPGNGATHKGTVTTDGGTYDIYTATRTNEPSIIGTASFSQFWSVRQTPRQTGTVTFANHVSAWAANGMTLGTTFDYQIVSTEAYHSSGTSLVNVDDVSSLTKLTVADPTVLTLGNNTGLILDTRAHFKDPVLADVLQATDITSTDYHGHLVAVDEVQTSSVKTTNVNAQKVQTTEIDADHVFATTKIVTDGYVKATGDVDAGGNLSVTTVNATGDLNAPSGNLGIVTINASGKVNCADVNASGAVNAGGLCSKGPLHLACNVNSFGHIYLRSPSTEYAVYVASTTAGGGIPGSTPVAGYQFSDTAVRLRVLADNRSGFVFENSNDQLLMSVRGIDALTWMGGNLDIAGSFSTPGTIKGTDVNAGGNISCTALNASGDVNAGGNVGCTVLNASGDVNAGANMGCTVLNASSDVNAGGNVGCVALNASGVVKGNHIDAVKNSAGTGGDINAAGNLGAVTVNASGDVNATGNMGCTVLNASSDVNAGGNVGCVTLNASKNVNCVDVNASGAVNAGGLCSKGPLHLACNVNSFGHIYLRSPSTEYAVYVASTTAGGGIPGSTPVAGYQFSDTAVRLRVLADNRSGFVFENSNDQLLMSVRGIDALTWMGGNLDIAGSFSTPGTMTGNILKAAKNSAGSGGNITADGTVTGNIIKAAKNSAGSGGNITADGTITGATVSATGSLNGGNISCATIDASGNVNAKSGNVSSDSLWVTKHATVDSLGATSTIQGNNLNAALNVAGTGGQVNASGAMTANSTFKAVGLATFEKDIKITGSTSGGQAVLPIDSLVETIQLLKNGVQSAQNAAAAAQKTADSRPSVAITGTLSTSTNSSVIDFDGGKFINPSNGWTTYSSSANTNNWRWNYNDTTNSNSNYYSWNVYPPGGKVDNYMVTTQSGKPSGSATATAAPVHKSRNNIPSTDDHYVIGPVSNLTWLNFIAWNV